MAQTSLNEFIDVLSKANAVEDIHEICSGFCYFSEFEHFIYGARMPTSLTQPSFIYVSGYPGEWRERYLERNYLSIDPVVAHCARSSLPINWRDVAPLEKKDKVVREFMGDVRDHNLKSGISFPVHTSRGESAMFSLAASDDHKKAKARIDAASPNAVLFTAYLHEAVRKVFAKAPLSVSQIKLTAREKQCLLWAAEGKTTWETARILNISERTVIFHVQNAAEKLNVVNRQQAIARAVSTGLIAPQFN